MGLLAPSSSSCVTQVQEYLGRRHEDAGVRLRHWATRMLRLLLRHCKLLPQAGDLSTELIHNGCTTGQVSVSDNVSVSMKPLMCAQQYADPWGHTPVSCVFWDWSSWQRRSTASDAAALRL